MNVDQVSTIFALLGFIAVAAALALVVATRLGGPDLRRDLATSAFGFAFGVALVATLGSLYYSALQHYTPCRLCWWQRISMYPLVPILGIGLIRRDWASAIYGLPLAVIGLGWSIYHLNQQWFPGDSDSCSVEAPCSAQWVDTFGFVSIPFMAGCGFLAITIALITHLRAEAGTDPASATT